jgi:flagellar hook assembly protein FlgD
MPFVSSSSNSRFHRIALVIAVFAALAGAGGAWAAVTSVRAPRPVFSPNGDGVRDSVLVQWTLTAPAESVLVEVHPPFDALFKISLRTFRLGPRPAGRDSVIWDGRGDDGTLLPDSLYNVRVVEKALPDTILSFGVVAVELDVTPPQVPSFDPAIDNLDTTDSTLSLAGIAQGRALFVVLYEGGVPRDTLPVAPGDTTFSTVVTLAEGSTTFALRSEDPAGNTSALSLASTVTYRNTAEVSDFRVTPSRFSPDGDGVLDTLHTSLRLDAATTRLEVQIRKTQTASSTLADSVPFVRLFDGPAAAGAYAFAWDGRDSTGAIAPQGGYFVFVSAESATVAGLPAAGRPRTIRVELDLTPPLAPVLNPPLPSFTSHSVIHLVGVVSGGDSVRVYRNGARIAQGPSNFDLVATLSRGTNSFVLEGVDAAGNVSAPAGPFVVTYDEVAGFHAPERFRRGDVFEVNLASAPREIRIDLYALDGRKLRSIGSTSTNPSQELAWNLLDDSGNEVGDGPVIARLIVSYANGRVDRTKAAIVVAK